MDSNRQEVDVLVLGAGVSGLMAARALQQAGRRVGVVDKGRGVGGRLATRRIGDATFDHGAPCFSTGEASDGLRSVWHHLAGSVTEWGSEEVDGAGRRPCWRGVPTMSAVAKRLADGLEVHTEVQIASLGLDAGRWVATAVSGRVFVAETVVATPPVPQTLALLEAGGFVLADGHRTRLAAIGYDRCLTVMAVLENPSLVPPPGSLSPVAGPIERITDNRLKGISAVPAVTLHATPGFSLEHWDLDRLESGRILLEAATPWLGSAVRTWQIHGWRYGRPRAPLACRHLLAHASPALVFAGDAFGGPGVDAAAGSGAAAAAAILSGR